jgi:phenylpyruvate tautomerase PptA (4-oxalocrotonate tautomerase family)
MEIDNYIKTIQESCTDFIKQNLVKVLTQIEQNKTLLDNNYTEIKIDHIDKKSWGVYVFYINPQKEILTYDDLKNLWKTDLNDKPLQSPTVIKGKFKVLTAGKSACFYVGKSENLASRISQHIHQSTKPSTYGLKISEHNRLHSDNTFAYSYFVLKTNPADKIKDGMKCLLVTLERHLRDKLKPLIGKQ